MSAPVNMLLGVVKGGVIGSAAGLGVSFALRSGASATWVSMLLAGALVSIVSGTPFWKNKKEENILKFLFGAGFGALANWAFDKWLGFVQIPTSLNLNGDATQQAFGNSWVGVAVFAAAWGLLVGLDDSVGNPPAETPQSSKPKAK
jgi:hypothetical protein